ncbi:MAG: L-threonylcarbamoyladenylate synthase [Betaproteobacteria bacterium]|nr:L-threonylcarbamoyladenylate synthase [Betaproteobacteria bacterium]
MTPEIRRAAEILRAGGLVAFPTETVYGLGAGAANPEAVARLFAVKGRPADHPVIVHFADAEQAFGWAREVPPGARRLAARFWPGPLTMILRRAARVGDFVTGGQDTVGLRVPAHPVAQELLKAFGGAVAAPSANRFGRVSPTRAEHVRADLGDEVDLVLEGGASEVGIESTIVDLSGERPRLLRPGAIAMTQLEQVLGEPVAAADSAAPRAPGTLERHYAPKTPLRIVPSHALDAEVARAAGRVAVLAFSRPDERVRLWLRMPRDAAAYAHRLYAALRELDAAGCDRILVEAPPEEPAWQAVRDRLARAAA